MNMLQQQDPRLSSSTITWNPHTNNTLAKVGKDLRYYKINEQVLNNNSNAFDDSDEEMFSLLSTQELQYEPKCAAWSPAFSNILAVGTSVGKVMLHDVKKQSVMKEFNPKNQRCCNAISWNQVQTNYFATGLDKVRSDYCVLIWDINEVGNTLPINNDFFSAYIDNFNATKSVKSDEVVSKPLYEIGYNEATTALSWHPDQAFTIVVGTSSKWIRAYDLRENFLAKATKSASAHAKSVNGIAFNPFDSKIFATFSVDEPQIKLWDFRSFNEPFRIIPADIKSNAMVSQIAWSPCQKNVIGALNRDGSCVKIYDLSEDRSDKPIGFKYSQHKSLYSKSGSISSFSFHPKVPRSVAVASLESIEFLAVKESPSFRFSPHSTICQASKSTLYETNLPVNDISITMKYKANKGLGTNVHKNATIVKHLGNDDTLFVWNWMVRMKQLHEIATKTKKNYDYSGVWSILGLENQLPPQPPMPPVKKPEAPAPGTSMTTTQPLTARRKESTNMNVTSSPLPSDDPTGETVIEGFKRYTSAQRNIILQICGWDSEQLKMETEKNERTVAIAIFHLDIKHAIKILTTLDNAGGENSNHVKSNYKFLAFALTGYSRERVHEFKEICQDLHPQLENPYLRAALAFLSSDFKYILREEKVSLSDRVAFACLYLNDEELAGYVKRMKELSTLKGDLQGILLTGLGKDGVALMQRYVDRTGDIQTACLLMRHVVPKKFKDERVEIWLECYRELLDSWKMWEERALLDAHLAKHAGGVQEQKSPEVVVRCTFCSQSLIHGSTMQTGRGSLGALMPRSAPTNRPKSTSCPNCRKPLPKCSICLMHFGTPAESMGEERDNENNLTTLDYCFAWCTVCSHGGHVKHLMEWFDRHDQCSVAGCNCTCNLVTTRA